nr:Uncharacterised protein [Klebsiella pneumoniae]
MPATEPDISGCGMCNLSHAQITTRIKEGFNLTENEKKQAFACSFHAGCDTRKSLHPAYTK